MAALLVTDRADGTGADAAVSGFGAGEAVTLRAQRVDGGLGGTAWTTLGSRTGNGAIAANVAVAGDAYYWWQAVGSTGLLANLVYQPITDGLAALMQRIFDAAEARIRLLALDGIVQVLQLRVPQAERYTLPCVLLTPFQKTESMLGGTTGHDHLGYPVGVVFISRDPYQQEHNNRLLLWRQRVSRAFRYQRLPGAAEVWYCEIVPDVIAQVEGDKLDFHTSGMVLNFMTREPRGLGA